MAKPMTLLPRKPRVATFTAFERYRQIDKQWSRDESCDTVHAKVNTWLDETHAQIQEISAPSVSLYNERPDPQKMTDLTVRLLVVSVTVLYLPASEGTDDECRAAPGVGSVVGSDESEGKDGSTVYRPKEAS